MATSILQLHVDDETTYEIAKDGYDNYLRVKVDGQTAHQLWLPESAARRLHATLTAGLAEIDERRKR